MAQRTFDDTNTLNEAYACLLSNGLHGAAKALRIPVNDASNIERAADLGATPLRAQCPSPGLRQRP